MREQFGVLALGQAGGNIGKEFEDLGYTTVYVNTSKEDLSTIKGTHKRCAGFRWRLFYGDVSNITPLK
jgi:hypothetical protein